ncbi:MAG: hypothetical protein ACK44G_15610, partial [Aphanizomenon sp.]
VWKFSEIVHSLSYKIKLVRNYDINPLLYIIFNLLVIGDLLTAALGDRTILKNKLILSPFLPEKYRLNKPRRNEDHEERGKIGNLMLGRE